MIGILKKDKFVSVKAGTLSLSRKVLIWRTLISEGIKTTITFTQAGAVLVLPQVLMC